MEDDSDRKMILDDEMSRFEAAISGTNSSELAPPPPPPGIGPLQPPRPKNQSQSEPRTIIGSNTFNKVQQQLQRPPAPPSFPQPMIPPQHMEMRPPMQMGPMPPPFMPGPAQFDPPVMGPNINPPGSFGPPNPPMQGPSPNNFIPHPQKRVSDPIYKRREDLFHPTQNVPPPNFLPPQLNRPNFGQPMNNDNTGGPRGPTPFLPPPPTPPTLGSHKTPKQTIAKGPVIYKAPSAVVSSAPKIYTSETKDTAVEENKEAGPPAAKAPPTPEPKKKKQKAPTIETSAPNVNPNASKMAEKVLQSTTTTVTSAPKAFPPPPSKKDKKFKKKLRYAGGQVWEDTSLDEWEKDDFRLFVGDLGNDVTDDFLTRHFSHFPTFSKAKVVRDKRTNKTKGFGFVSFKGSQDYIRAMKEMNGKYLGSRPIKLRKSNWKDRNLESVYKKMKEKASAGLKF